MRRRAVGWLLALACAAGGCAGEKAPEQRPTVRRPATGSQADAETLGHEVFDLVDRAVDYRGERALFQMSPRANCLGVDPELQGVLGAMRSQIAGAQDYVPAA